MSLTLFPISRTNLLQLRNSFLIPLVAVLVASALRVGAQTENWQIIGSLPSSSSFPEVQVINQNQILVFAPTINDYIGGENWCVLIDGETETMTRVGDLNEKRALATSVVMPDGSVYVFGGNSTSSSDQVGSIERFDPKEMKWTVVGQLTRARSQLVCAAINDHEVIIVGGRIGVSNVISDCEIFDTRTHVVRPIKAFPYRTSFPKVVVTSDGKILCFAGRSGGPGSYRSNKIHEYDVTNDTWTVFGSTDSTYYPTITTTSDGTVLWTGGSYRESEWQDQFTQQIAVLYGDKFIPIGQLAQPRVGHGCVEVSEGKMLVVGGSGNYKNGYKECEYINIADGSVTVGPSLNVGRGYTRSVAVETSTGRKVFAIGGMIQGSGRTATVEVLKTESNCTRRFKPLTSDMSNITHRGTAFWEDSIVVLTGTQAFEAGSVWSNRKVVTRTGFDTRFVFRFLEGNDTLAPDGGSPGGEGIAFVIQNTSQTMLGGTGEGIGYTNIPTAIAVEFDSYVNENENVLLKDHVAVQVGKDGWLTSEHNDEQTRAMVTDGVPKFVADGRLYHARILYRQGQLMVWLSMTEELGEPIIDVALNIADALQLDEAGDAWMGFTSSTGEATERHEIVGWTLNDCPNGDADVPVLPNFEEFSNDKGPIEDFRQSHIRVSPNPASTFANITLSEDLRGKVDVKVYDMTGVVHYSGTLQDRMNVFDANPFAPGTYIVVVRSTDGVESTAIWKIVR